MFSYLPRCTNTICRTYTYNSSMNENSLPSFTRMRFFKHIFIHIRTLSQDRNELNRLMVNVSIMHALVRGLYKIKKPYRYEFSHLFHNLFYHSLLTFCLILPGFVWWSGWHGAWIHHTDTHHTRHRPIPGLPWGGVLWTARIEHKPRWGSTILKCQIPILVLICERRVPQNTR